MSDMHSLLIAAILGVVEGLTEFLPVSSTGHMIIVGHLLGFEGDTAKTFEVVIQLGSILAVVVMFWRRLFGLIGIHFGRPLQHEGESKGRLTLIHILLGMIPAVVLGLLFHDTIKSLFNPINVMYALVVGGLLLIAAECLKPKEPRAPGLEGVVDGEDRLQTVGGRPPQVRDQPVQFGVERVQAVSHDLTQDVALGREGREDAADRNRRQAGDLADGGGVEALGLEQVSGGVEHALTRRLLLGLTYAQMFPPACIGRAGARHVLRANPALGMRDVRRCDSSPRS